MRRANQGEAGRLPSDSPSSGNELDNLCCIGKEAQSLCHSRVRFRGDCVLHPVQLFAKGVCLLFLLIVRHLRFILVSPSELSKSKEISITISMACSLVNRKNGYPFGFPNGTFFSREEGMIGLSQDMQEVVSIAPTGSSPSRDGLLQAKFVLLHRGGNGTLQWGHWIYLPFKFCLPSVELLVRHWLLALLHETKDFLPSQWFWRGEKDLELGAKRPTLVGLSARL